MQNIYTLTMETVGNPDRQQYVPITNPEDFWGFSIGELKNKLVRWRDFNTVGFSNWVEPILYLNGEQIGYFSYNLRLWKLPMGEPQVEVTTADHLDHHLRQIVNV